jgi:hypothetical protein
VKKLRQAVDEVDDLRDEEEEQGLAEVTQNGDHGQRHAAKKLKNNNN